MNKTLAELGDTVTDTLSDAWSATSSFAGDQLSDSADRVGTLYGKARDRVRPPKRHFNPWFVVAAGLATFVAVGWWLRRRGQPDDRDERRIGDGPNPLAREYPADARAAAHG